MGEMTMPGQLGGIERQFAAALAASRDMTEPFNYWLLSDALSPSARRQIVALPLQVPEVGDTLGRRETHNALRVFVSPDLQAEYPVLGELAATFQSPDIIHALSECCGVQLDGSFLRIEYCLDRNGFWLEPHTDIGAKRFTLLIYLSDDPGAENWGTDIYDPALRHVGRASAAPGNGLIFIPGEQTWHGFEARPIAGVRRTLIVNYVVPEWRSRHELAFPDQPVSATV